MVAAIDSILCFIMSLNVLSYRQDKRMDELNLFIEHYSKYIVFNDLSKVHPYSSLAPC